MHISNIKLIQQTQYDIWRKKDMFENNFWLAFWSNMFTTIKMLTHSMQIYTFGGKTKTQQTMYIESYLQNDFLKKMFGFYVKYYLLSSK